MRLAAAPGIQQTLAKLLPKWSWCPPETPKKVTGEGWKTGMFPISRKEKSDDTSNTSMWFLSPLGFLSTPVFYLSNSLFASANGTHSGNLYISSSPRHSAEQRENRDHHRQGSPVLHWLSCQVLPVCPVQWGGLNHLGTLNFLFDLSIPKLEMLAFYMFPSSSLLPFLPGPSSLGVL